MIEQVDCVNCDNPCCISRDKYLGVTCVAGLVDYLGDCEFVKEENGLGTIYYQGKEFVEIIELNGKTGARIKRGGCLLFNDQGLCDVHDKIIDKNSTLGKNLKVIGLGGFVKPFTCRSYPYEYDNELGVVTKQFDCKDLVDDYVPVLGHEELKKESELRSVNNMFFSCLLNVMYKGKGYCDVMRIVELLREERLPKNWKKHLLGIIVDEFQ